jgi:hypothetical protein
MRGTIGLCALALLLVGPGASGPGVGRPLISGRTAAASSECSTIAAEYPGIDSAAFEEVCALPAFQTALALYGIANFSVGGSGGRNWSVQYYVFNWVGTCTNATWAPYGGPCSEQEYWAFNLSSGRLSGPTFQNNPAVCGCPAMLEPFGPPLFLVPVFAAAVILSAVVITSWVRRTRRPPPAGSERAVPRTVPQFPPRPPPRPPP